MTSDDYRAAIQALGFASINEAGRWFGADERNARRWAQDGPPDSIAKLLELMLALDLRPEDVDSEIGRWRRRSAHSDP